MRILYFLARSAPKTPVQRIGAVLMGLNTLLCTAVILMTITEASSYAWTGLGVAGSVVGISIIFLLLPIGIAHVSAAIFPQILDHIGRKPNRGRAELHEHFANRFRDLYLVLGWLALIGAVMLLSYMLAFLLL
ncbi:hypothetical protein [Cochlodiniinecator piscidefendens]|uniref:hypothetical protein n=1 Tax=Cochlodiniinecator piscidefendens TaxID=2715756 RepID=UPI00140C1303|nr:hypothetical protein [Cochlodiniinecator piscidefendens]